MAYNVLLTSVRKDKHTHKHKYKHTHTFLKTSSGTHDVYQLEINKRL